MRSLLTFCLSFCICVGAHAQIFWNENFETGAATGLEVSSYTSSNGSWTLTTGSEGTYPNPWYVSCEEAGHIAGDCGTTCAATFGLGATLHISADPILIGDAGATYDAGGILNTTTDRRAESPVINCSGHSNITLRFYYIENGQGTSDDGIVWYYDGTSWAVLVNTAKTSTCGGQGLWAQYAAVLPASANNNPNVKIGFQWINNNDGAGVDPSFAIDSITLSTASGMPPPVASFTGNSSACEDSCITFTSTSTGTVDTMRWTVSPTAGATIGTPTASVSTICFSAAGTYSVTLTVGNTGGANSNTHVVTINPAPHPVIVRTGNTFSVTATYTSYQWYKNGTIIGGATARTYTTTVKASYSVTVDSGGCKGSATFSTLGTNTLSSADQHFWVSSADDNTMSIYSGSPLDDALTATVYDATGRKMYHDLWPAGSSQKQLDISTFPSGMYIIRLSNRDASVVLRWIK